MHFTEQCPPKAKWDIVREQVDNLQIRIRNEFDFLFAPFHDYADSLNGENFSQSIFTYYVDNINGKSIDDIYSKLDLDSISFKFDDEDGDVAKSAFLNGIPFTKTDKIFSSFYLGIPFIYYRYDPYSIFTAIKKDHENRYWLNDKLNALFQHKKQIDSISESVNTESFKLLEEKISQLNVVKESYDKGTSNGIKNYISFLLYDSFYFFFFDKDITIKYEDEKHLLHILYRLPNISDLDFQYLKRMKNDNIWKNYSTSKCNSFYKDCVFSIIIRTLGEIFNYDYNHFINYVAFNGYVNCVNGATGNRENRIITSINVNRDTFSTINLSHINPEACFNLNNS